MIKIFSTISLMLFVFYNTFAQTWVPRANVGGPPRTSAAAFTIGSKGYVCTGDDGTPGSLNDLWEYDPVTDVWTQKASLPVGGMNYAGGFSISNRGYICTGGTGSYNFWEWNQAKDTWMYRATLPGGWRSGFVAFSIGKKGYMGLGSVMSGDTNDLWEFDGDTLSPTFNTWTQKANFIGGSGTRREAVCFTIGKKGYVATGGAPLIGYKELWEFNGDTTSPTYNTWTQKANFGGKGRHAAAGFAIGTKAYLGTGDDGDSLRSDFWEWDQLTDTWTQKPWFPGGARFAAIGLSIGNKGYIGTGNNYGASYFGDFWEYCDTCTDVGIKENELLKHVLIYPNPATEIIYVYNLPADAGVTITLSNVAGQEVKSEKLGSHKINVSTLNNGIYFLKIETKNVSAVKKVIVQR